MKRYRNGGKLDEIQKQLYILPVIDINLGPDTTICPGDSIQLSVTDSYCTFNWINSGSVDTIFSDTAIISTQAEWWPVVANYYDYCGSLDSVVVNLHADTLDLGGDSTGACISNLLVLDAFIDSIATYLWSTGDSSSSILADESGVYYVSVSYVSCVFTDTISILYDEFLELELVDTIFSCDFSLVELNAGDFPADFIWSPSGSTGPVIFTDSSGLYSVTATNNCGNFSDSSVVINLTSPTVTLPMDTIVCENDTIFLDITEIWNSYQWSTGDTLGVLEVIYPGYYIVTVSNACDTSLGAVSVIHITQPLVELGEDTLICIGDSILLIAPQIPLTEYLWSTGESTSTIFAGQNDNYSITISNACGSFEDSLLLTTHFNSFGFNQDSVPIFPLQTIILDAGSDYVSYYWSTADTTQSINVNTPGIYWIEVIDTIGCLGSDTLIVYRYNNTKYHGLDQIKVYPNPVRNRLILDNLSGNETITLFDKLGRQVFYDQVVAPTAKLDVRRLTSGIYIVLIQSETIRMHFRIQKI